MKKKKSKPSSSRRGKDPSPYPKGMNRKKVEKVIAYYDKQSDDEAIAEAEAAYKSNSVTMMAVPKKLVPKVQKLIARRAG